MIDVCILRESTYFAAYSKLELTPALGNPPCSKLGTHPAASCDPPETGG